MEFRIADTFTESLARLTGDEQKAVKTTAFDLQLNPANPGIGVGIILPEGAYWRAAGCSPGYCASCNLLLVSLRKGWPGGAFTR